MELFEAIRREYEFGIGTVQGVARRFGVHRRLVREALGSAVPGQTPAAPRLRPTVAPVRAFIEAILEADQRAPRKQRHTAHRIWRRLQQERPAHPIAESTVRQFVREWKLARGGEPRETAVPQQHAWGDEAQADWYEAVVELGGERRTVQIFALRSMASGGAFHRAYHRATQQAFLEAHEHAFRYFGGVFRRLRYDNLTLAVRKILRGSRREETARFVAFRSHWRFAAEFCTPGEAHEKGGIEGEVGRFRRAHLVPVPAVADLDTLNARLLEACRRDEGRTVSGRPQPVGEAMLVERPQLLALAEPFDLVEVSFPTVTALGCVRVKTNAYSVPCPPGTTVEVRLTAAAVGVWWAGRCVTTHERSYARGQEILDLEHYLDVLEQKPGALAGSTPLARWRRSGKWPASYDRLWQALITRQGRSGGTRAMVRLLQLGRTHGHDRLRAAVEAALTLGCTDPAAVEHLLTAPSLVHSPPAPLVVGSLAAFERPLPAVSDYDHLLAPERVGATVGGGA